MTRYTVHLQLMAGGRLVVRETTHDDYEDALDVARQAVDRVVMYERPSGRVLARSCAEVEALFMAYVPHAATHAAPLTQEAAAIARNRAAMQKLIDEADCDCHPDDCTCGAVHPDDCLCVAMRILDATMGDPT